jgi:hypothetical protein
MAWIIKVVNQALLPASLNEVLEEFVAVIGLYPGYFKGSYLSEFDEEVPGAGRRAGFVDIGESETGGQVDGGNEVAFQSVHEDIDSIYLDQLTGEFRPEAFSAGFEYPGLGLTDM